MKKSIVMSFAFLTGILLTDQYAFGQASNKNMRHLHIDKKGEIKDDYGTRIIYISKEVIVNNNSDDKLGFMGNGKVYDVLGKPMGKAKKNGKYYNNRGVNVLSAKGNDDTCQTLDPKGHKSGIIHKNYKLHACSAHCFFLKKRKERC